MLKAQAFTHDGFLTMRLDWGAWNCVVLELRAHHFEWSFQFFRGKKIAVFLGPVNAWVVWNPPF